MNTNQINVARGVINFGTKSNIPKCIILMGFPGSGKSYLSSYLHDKHGFTVLSGENITHAIYNTEKCSSEEYKNAYNVLNYLAVELLKDGFSIVIDGTNLKRIFRDNIRNLLGHLTDKIFGIYLYIDEEISFNRANSRGINKSNPKNILSSVSRETFESFKEKIELPGEDELFYSIRSDEKLFDKIDELLLKN